MNRRFSIPFTAMLAACLGTIGLVAVAPGPVGASTVGDSGAIDGGDDFTCALTDAGGVKCWGANSEGQLGDGTVVDRLTPTPVNGLTEIAVEITVGWHHACVRTDAGGVTCWGLNNFGQLGDGTTSNRATPVDVVGLSSGVVAISAGVFHTCAVLDGGGVKCWGRNNNGELGDGTQTDRATPVDVVGLGTAVQGVAGGLYSTCALTDAGGVKCWGWNGAGGLGDGTTIDRATPVDVVGLSTGATAVTVHGTWPIGSRACALTTSGGVKCWGTNDQGQLGDGTTVNRLTPVDVVGLDSGVAAITTGSSQTCALTEGGGVKCWGRFGVGDGSGVLRTAPVDVVGLGSGVDEIDSGGFHVCAITTSGGVTCWGGNHRGQLGLGVTATTAPTLGRIPHDVSGSFYRPECPTLIPEPHTDFSMVDGYAVGSGATFVADPGYALTGAATLTCRSDLTWDGTVPGAAATSTVTVTPDTGQNGGQVVEVALSGFAPSADLGWCQGLSVPDGVPDSSYCSDPIGLGPADENGELTTSFRLQRFIYVPALDDWVDCADPAEICLIGAADIADLGDSTAWTFLDFAPPPDPPAERGEIVLSPAQVTGPGETVTVTGTGFRPDAFVDVHQCEAEPVGPSDCNRPSTSVTADASGGFVTEVVVAALVDPPGGSPTDCFAAPDACAIAAAEAVDFPGTVVTALIEEPPPLPVVRPGGAVIEEGDAGTAVIRIPVTLSAPSPDTVTVQWSTIFSSAWSEQLRATPGEDYEPVTDGFVSFAPGETDTTVPITVHGDTTIEADELLVVSFHDPVNARIGGFYGLGFGLIGDDDTPPTVLPGGVTVVEGDDGTQVMNVPVTLSAPWDETVTVQWSTVFDPAWSEVAARPGEDYEPVTDGFVSFAPGETDTTVPITVHGDTTIEPDELLVVSFHDPVNARIGGYWGLGFGLITNDD